MRKGWTVRKKQARLERRIEFDDYEQTRQFLEQAAELSEKVGYYPDMSFGRTYVSVTIYPQDDEEQISTELFNFASEMDKLVDGAKVIN